MHPLQLVAILVLGIGAGIYVWRVVHREMREEEEFFEDLVHRLSQVLEPKGFRLTKRVYLRRLFGYREAMFEGVGSLRAVWDPREREICLLQREPAQSSDSTDRNLAGVFLPRRPEPDVYAGATEVILSAARSIEGAA